MGLLSLKACTVLSNILNDFNLPSLGYCHSLNHCVISLADYVHGFVIMNSFFL